MTFKFALTCTAFAVLEDGSLHFLQFSSLLACVAFLCPKRQEMEVDHTANLVFFGGGGRN